MNRLLLTGILALSLLACQSDHYLEQALLAEEWLEQSTIRDNGHRVWPDATDDPGKISVSYSDGIAGKLAFYLELHQSTGNERFEARAREIGDYLLTRMPQKTDSLKGEFWAFSPYGGVCAPGFAMTELYKATGEQQYKQAALSVVEVLDHFAVNKADTLSWDLGNDVLGGLSGTGLFLLYMHRELGAVKALNMAERAGHTLISRALELEEGYAWRRGEDSRYILPSFSHGPAGIAYFFASLYEATGKEVFMEAALKAVTYLDAIARTDGDIYMLPYGFPDRDWARDYDIGWAHGPAGVARLFIKLHQITKETQWLDRAEACFSAILSANVTGEPGQGFGTEPFSIDQRFGLSGVANFAQDMYRYTGDERYLDFSTKLADFIMSKSKRENGLSWPMERFGFMANAGEVTTFTGYFYGSVGMAVVLLEQSNVNKGRGRAIRFVDDPF